MFPMILVLFFPEHSLEPLGRFRVQTPSATATFSASTVKQSNSQGRVPDATIPIVCTGLELSRSSYLMPTHSPCPTSNERPKKTRYRWHSSSCPHRNHANYSTGKPSRPRGFDGLSGYPFLGISVWACVCLT